MKNDRAVQWRWTVSPRPLIEDGVFICYLCSSKQDLFDGSFAGRLPQISQVPPHYRPLLSHLDCGSTFRDLGRILPPPQTPTCLSASFRCFFPLLSWIDDGVIASPMALLRGRRGGGGEAAGPQIENGSFSSAGPPSDRQRSRHVTNAVNVPPCSRCPANQGSAVRLLRRTSRKKQFEPFLSRLVFLLLSR